MDLAGKVALVTGGSRGIGRAVSLKLAALGAKILVNYVSGADAALEVVATICEAGGEAEVIQLDVSQFTAVQEAIKEVVKKEGHLDILVNNAGITRDGLLVRMKEDAWDEVIDTNLKGAFNCIKAASKPMMKQRWGRIVNISSVVGFTGNAGQVNYCSAKAGLVGMTKSVARELASRGITVNGVAPGYIETEMTSGLSEEVTEKILAEIPMGTLGHPEDIANAVAYLVSTESHYLTGQFIHVNGGMLM